MCLMHLQATASTKKAWELDKILALFHEEKGRHFNPIVVETFLQNLDEILRVKDKLPD